MGEAADRVNGAEQSVGKVSGEIVALRGELGALVAELDRRRHEMFDLGLQARRHPVAFAVAAAAVALVAGGLLAVAVRSARRRRSPAVRAREARRALARLMDHPHRVAAEPSIGRKIGLAVGTVVATAIAKRLIQRTVRPPAQPRPVRVVPRSA